MSPQVVLDTSAVAAYAHGSLAVGELIMMVADEGDEIGVPMTCVAEVYAAVEVDGVEAAMLDHLTVAVPGIVVLPLDLPDAAEIGRYARSSSLGVGHAIVTAINTGCYLATADGKTVRRLVDDDRNVIDI